MYPGGGENADSQLLDIANKYGWSCLYLYDDLLAQAQNTAITLHPNAKWIYKIDEDIVLSHDFFLRLKDSYEKADRESSYRIGFAGPLINLNANGIEPFLKTVYMFDEFEKKFSKHKIRFEEGADKDIVHCSQDVAEFVWNVSQPFDQVSQKIYEKNKGQYFVAPIRYSIGAILFTRDFWEQIGQFKVGFIGAMGTEEAQICNYCMEHMYAIVVAKDVFVGHLGFYRQKAKCKELFNNIYL